MSLQKSGEQPESMTSKDAAMFPIIASCTLLGLYIFFKVSVHVHVFEVKLKTLCEVERMATTMIQW